MIALQDLLKRRLLSDELAEQAADAVLRQLAVPRHRAKGVRRETAIRWHYGVQTSALGAVQRLAKTEYLQAPENREIALGHARLLADSSDEHVRASACGVLGVLGDGDDVALLRELAAREASPVVRRSIAWAQSMLWG